MCNLLADEAGLTGRVRGVEGDAQNLPFRSNFADLVVSRGSVFFWPDQLAGVMEAYRILKPGGVAFLGGGFSRILAPAIRDKLVAERRASMAREAQEPSGWHPWTRISLRRPGRPASSTSGAFQSRASDGGSKSASRRTVLQEP